MDLFSYMVLCLSSIFDHNTCSIILKDGVIRVPQVNRLTEFHQ